MWVEGSPFEPGTDLHQRFMKRIHGAVLIAQVLSYGLIITFIFADMAFNLSGVLRFGNDWLTKDMAHSFVCLVGLVGAINLWLTWYYIRKSNTMRDWLVLCAWTHRVKQGDKWVSLEEFLDKGLGFQVSHGLSDPAAAKMREQLDANWQRLQIEPPGPNGKSKPPQTESPPGPLEA